jgi:hypothetical protein
MPLEEVDFWKYVFGLKIELADNMEQNMYWAAESPKLCSSLSSSNQQYVYRNI